MNDGFIYTLKGKKKIKDLLRSSPVSIDRQGMRNVPFHETFIKQASPELGQGLPFSWTVPSLPHYWAQDRPKVKLAFEFQLTLDKNEVTAAYFPNM